MLKDLLAKLKRRLFLSHLIPIISREFARLHRRLDQFERRLASVQESLGRVEARQTAAVPADDLHASEFRVYSQWGEDGIIQHLLRHVPIRRKLFVEVGVESFQEANTRFLLVNNNWTGLVIEADAQQVARIKAAREYWLYNLKVVQAFVTRENINSLLAENGINGDIGLLSIDIDGMDYWIWEAIETITPAIVVIEYNYRFGSGDAVVVPYDASFDRKKAHSSILYYGASLAALAHLGQRKGYALVGCGSAGLNAFFVRRNLLPDTMRELSAGEAYVAGQFCEAHDPEGNRIKLSNEEQARLVNELPLVRLNGSVK
jgi:hypothetical protein